MTEPIIDAHHHIWRLAETPWLRDASVPRIFGEYSALTRDYSIDEYLRTVRPAGVVKSVFVQVNVAPGREAEEVAWVQSVADAHGLPNAIVGYANPASPEVAATLERQMQCSNLRGVRYQLHWHENPQYSYTPRPDIMNDAGWRRGLREVEKRGLLFELQVFAWQMSDAARLAADYPGLTFVLLHAGMLQDRSDAGWSAWRTGMRALAARPNVVTKLSGLGTFLRQCSPPLWRPVIEETLAIFGPQRCLYGSNFPIESLWATYGEVLGATKAALGALTPAERRAVLHDNAAGIYRI